MKLNKSSLILMAMLLTTSCTNPGSTLKTAPEQLISVNKIAEPDTELDKEYVFSSKALTKNYFKRKLDKWLNPVDGPKLTKELAYARLKHPELYDELMFEFPPMYTAINIPQEIINRKNLEPAFKEFIEMSDPFPDIPVALAATNITPTSFTANWNAAAKATSYTLYVTDTGTAETTPYVLGDVTTLELTGLNSSSSYSYYVKSTNHAGTSAASTIIPVNTLIPAPGTPVANSATAITPNSFTANWELVNGASGYTLYVTDTNTNTTTPYELGVVTSKNITGLNSSTSYSYYVKANNSTDISPASATIPVTTLIQIPGVPTAVDASAITPTSFTANWGFVNGAESYTLYVTDSGSNTTQHNLGNVNSLDITGLNSSAAYSYYVTATNTTGTSSASNVIQVNTIVPVPDIPVTSAATELTPTSFTANWGAANNATSYTLYVVDSLANTTPYVLGNVTSKNVTGLNSNAAYSYYVTATNTTGTSAVSNSTPVTTLLPAPASGSFTATSSSITLNWTQVSDVAGYKIYKDGNPTAIATITPGSTLTFTDSGLLTNENHSYKIYSFNGAVESSSFLTINAKTFPIEFRANTYTQDKQNLPGIAMDSDGDFVITWYSSGQDGSNNGIFAQRYNSDGTPQDPEFRVNTYVNNSQETPTVAMDNDGDFVITWASNGQDGSNYGIYAKRYNSSGIALGDDFKVNTYTPFIQANPNIAMDSDGDFVISWTDYSQDGSNYGIYAQRYNRLGEAQGIEFRVNTYTTSFQDGSSIAMDSDGDFVIAWNSRFQDGDGNGIYAQRYNAAGVPQGPEFRANSTAVFRQQHTFVRMDNDGDFVIVWESQNQDGSQYGIYAQRYNSSGTVIGSEFQINTYTTNTQINPGLAMDSDGDFVVSWASLTQDGDNYGIYAQRYNSSGVAQGAEFKVNSYTTGFQGYSVAAMDSTGNFVISWMSMGQDGSDGGIYAQRFNPSGNPK